jgi:hypothetical protein
VPNELMQTDKERAEHIVARCRAAIQADSNGAYYWLSIQDTERDLLIRLLSSMKFPRPAPLPRTDRLSMYRRVLKSQPAHIRRYFKEAYGWSWRAIECWYAAIWHSGYAVYCAVRGVVG